MEEREGQKKKLPIWAKILIAAGALAALFLTVFFLRDVPPFNSYRGLLIRTVNSILNDNERSETSEERVVESEDFKRIDQEVPFKVLRPQWLPEGYVLEFADYKEESSGRFSVLYKYISEDDKENYIEFTLNDFLFPDPSGYTVKFEELSINGMRVYMFDVEEDSSQAQFIIDQGLAVTVTGTINQETLIKIIENMS